MNNRRENHRIEVNALPGQPCFFIGSDKDRTPEFFSIVKSVNGKKITVENIFWCKNYDRYTPGTAPSQELDIALSAPLVAEPVEDPSRCTSAMTNRVSLTSNGKRNLLTVEADTRARGRGERFFASSDLEGATGILQKHISNVREHAIASINRFNEEKSLKII